LERVIFRNRDEPSGSIDLACRGLDNSDNAQLPSRLHDVKSPLDVGVDIRVRRVIRIGNGDQGGEMKNDVAPLGCGSDPVRIANITWKNLNVFLRLGRQAFQPAPGAERIVQNKGSDVGPSPTRASVKCEPIKPRNP